MSPAPDRDTNGSLDDLSASFRARFDATSAARERALPAARRSISASANAIRAIHRGELELAEELMTRSRSAIDEGTAALEVHPGVRFACFLQDAQKEFAEARISFAVVSDGPLPSAEDVGVEDAAYLNGMAEAIGEGRRHILDLLRAGEVERGERTLARLEEMYGVLVTMDYPDAITMNLRRSTDVARALIEKTRGDLSIAFVQRDIRDALERHARAVLGQA